VTALTGSRQPGCDFFVKLIDDCCRPGPTMSHEPAPRRTETLAGGSITRSLALGGALHGAVAWGAYAVVEHVLLTLSTLMHESQIVLAPHHWIVIATVVATFVATGFVLGGLVGLTLKALEQRGLIATTPAPAARLRTVAALTLTLAFGANVLAAYPFSKAEALSLAMSMVLAAALVLAAADTRWLERIGFLGNPWVASLLLLGGEFVVRRVLRGASGPLKLAGAAAALLVLALIAMAGSAFWERRGRPADAFLPARAAVVLAAAGAFVFGGSLLLGGGMPPLPPLASHAAVGRPNVVMVTMDTVRADHLSLYGYGQDTTPLLEELAKEATVYTNAVAASNVTLTSHASLFTGVYGSWHGAYLDAPEFPTGRPLDGRYPTLAEILSAKGFRTMAVVANSAYLNRSFGLCRGFQVHDVRSPVILADPVYLRNAVPRLLGLFVSTAEFDVAWRRADEVNEVGFALLERAKQEGDPFFLFLNYMDAHVPYVPPAPFDDLFPGRNRHIGYYAYKVLRDEVMADARAITPAERRQLISQYDGSIAYVDLQFARLISRLKDLGLFENTVIVVTSDHGEALGGRNLLEHGASLYQNQVHVPLIIKCPNQHQLRVVGSLVNQVDVMPTVLAALGFEVPKGVQGEKLQEAEKDRGRPVFSEFFHQPGPSGHTPEQTERAIFAGRMKLIVSASRADELYDLSRDPEEKENLFHPDDTRATALAARLNDWVKAVPVRAASSSVDQDLVRRLKALGYAQQP
jgi:arylsulfatase A-like enzyme